MVFVRYCLSCKVLFMDYGLFTFIMVIISKILLNQPRTDVVHTKTNKIYKITILHFPIIYLYIY